MWYFENKFFEPTAEPVRPAQTVQSQSVQASRPTVASVTATSYTDDLNGAIEKAFADVDIA
jgi:hypothetical protein